MFVDVGGVGTTQCLFQSNPFSSFSRSSGQPGERGWGGGFRLRSEISPFFKTSVKTEKKTTTKKTIS